MKTRISSSNPKKAVSDKTQMAVMATNIEYIKRELQEITDRLDRSYVRKDEQEILLHRLKLLEKIVYTTIGTIVLAFLSVLISIVFRGGI